MISILCLSILLQREPCTDFGWRVISVFLHSQSRGPSLGWLDVFDLDAYQCISSCESNSPLSGKHIHAGRASRL